MIMHMQALAIWAIYTDTGYHAVVKIPYLNYKKIFLAIASYMPIVDDSYN